MAFVYFLLSALGIVFKDSKKLAIVMAIMMWIIFGFTTYNGDFLNYEFVYININKSTFWFYFEPLFSLFMYICNILGLDFIQFRIVFGTIFIILTVYTINKYTKNIAEFLGIYMIFPFSYFTSVIRSGLATVIICLAYYQLIRKDKKIGIFWLLMVLATLFHYTSIFFCVFYFFNHRSKTFTIKIIIGIFIFFTLFYSGIIYAIISHIIPDVMIIRWFDPGRIDQKINWILYLYIISVVLIVISYIIKKQYEKNSYFIETYVEDVYNINLMLLAFSPSFFISNASARFIWQIMFFNIINIVKVDEKLAFTNMSVKINHNYKSKNMFFSKISLIYIFFTFLTLLYSNLPYRGTQNDFWRMFSYNLIFR